MAANRAATVSTKYPAVYAVKTHTRRIWRMRAERAIGRPLARLLVIAAVVLGLVAPAHAQQASGDSWLLHGLLTSYNGLQAADLSRTMYLLGAGQAREANPVFAPLASHPVAAGAVKLTLSTVTGLLLIHAHKEHPKAATWAAIIGNVALGAVVYHNSRIGVQR